MGQSRSTPIPSRHAPAIIPDEVYDRRLICELWIKIGDDLETKDLLSLLLICKTLYCWLLPKCRSSLSIGNWANTTLVLPSLQTLACVQSIHLVSRLQFDRGMDNCLLIVVASTQLRAFYADSGISISISISHALAQTQTLRMLQYDSLRVCHHSFFGGRREEHIMYPVDTPLAICSLREFTATCPCYGAFLYPDSPSSRSLTKLRCNGTGNEIADLAKNIIYPALRELDLQCSLGTDNPEELRNLLLACPNIQSLRLPGTLYGPHNFTYWVQVFQEIPNLKSLESLGCNLVAFEVLCSNPLTLLQDNTCLKRLSLAGTTSTNAETALVELTTSEIPLETLYLYATGLSWAVAHPYIFRNTWGMNLDTLRVTLHTLYIPFTSDDWHHLMESLTIHLDILPSLANLHIESSPIANPIPSPCTSLNPWLYPIFGLLQVEERNRKMRDIKVKVHFDFRIRMNDSEQEWSNGDMVWLQVFEVRNLSEAKTLSLHLKRLDY